ncbi:MAG: UvrD-helicase domain-containing protein [Bacteroidaceae bacterium]|nr:UvrD-helicase domain-containing protein [Bacteroidaceae bacterium]
MKNVTYINAGAGSGKTYRLTQTLTELIKDKKVKPEQVILTTFTTKAANEFKEKAKALLFDEGMYEAAVQLDHAMIGTVHSVCQRMIGKYWFNLGLSPNMGVMAEEDTKYYISQSLAELPTEDELKVLHEFARDFDVRIYENYRPKGIDYDFWQGHLKSIIDFATNYELEDFAKSEQESLDYIRQFVRAGATISISNAELDDMLSEARAYVQNSNRIKKKEDYFKSFDDIKRNSWKKSVAWYQSVQKAMDAKYGDTCATVLDRLADIWVSREIFDKQESYIKLLFNLAMRWKENFAQFKRDKNLLDYNDMEKYMRLLMQNEDIASEISQSYRYLFVDEFQDSSPIQVKIFDALSELMEHSYWVGDYKQAIYGFRGSDIALTKAVVDRVAMKENGCDTDTLDKSWRSLPDIVEVNNSVFEKTFANVLDKKNIHLDKVRENKTHDDSLRYFVAREGAGVAEHILKLLNKGAKPNEIAVLARANATLATVADNLKEWNIPSSREDYPVIESPVYPLVASLLRIVGSAKDALSKATVAILTESDWTTRQIIEAKILNDADAYAKTEDYLADVPLIRQLLTIRPLLQQQSVASLIESMIIELDLYDVVKKLSMDPAFGISCLQTIINTARIYEEHSVQMNLPATIDGFLAYIEEVSPVGSGDPNGVQLHTYHSCKGLQWKYVILMSLNTNVADLKKSVKNETYGVHAIHSEEPSADNPYPEVFIRLTPWVYGTAKNVPDEISVKIEESDSFKLAYKSMIAETNRVFYVGMTRPQDVLILNIDVPGRGQKLLQWPKDDGVGTVAENIPESGDWDVFGTGHQFKDFTLTESEAVNLKPYGGYDEANAMALNIGEPSFGKLDARYLSPSQIHAKGNVASHHDFNRRIPFAKQPSDMATVGDCIHQIYAGIEEPRPAYKIELDEIIESYGLNGVLADKNAITLAWKNLTDYLTAAHGPAVKTYHERPFRLEQDGQTIVGSIDFVWQTADGDILVDFKTCPMGPKAVLDMESEHYAGWYAGQLDAYQDALEANGENVIKRYIYYPVSGVLADVVRAILKPALDMYENIFCFDAHGIDLYKAVSEAINGFDDKVRCIEEEPDDEELDSHIYVMEGKSTQGINLILLKSGMVTVKVPYLASREDVAIAFDILRRVKAQDDGIIIYDSDEDTIAVLSENNEIEVYYCRLDNMARIIESQDNHIGVNGIKNEFHIEPSYIKACMPDADPKEWTLLAYRDFAEIQWNYDGYEYLSRAEIGTPDGEKFVARILTNTKGFAKVCEKVVLYHDKAPKIVDINDFFEKVKGNRYIKRLDYAQFVIDHMPEKEWAELYDSFNVEPIRLPKTYLLRWNPTISSFKLEAYRDAVRKYPNGFGSDWSIYEWEQAHEGDMFFMLRTGDDNPGIVWRGIFSSAPYEGDDWAGNNRKRMYVDFETTAFEDPDKPLPVSLAMLESAIPEIDWQKGHSGELLTDEQAETLNNLWEDVHPFD